MGGTVEGGMAFVADACRPAGLCNMRMAQVPTRVPCTSLCFSLFCHELPPAAPPQLQAWPWLRKWASRLGWRWPATPAWRPPTCGLVRTGASVMPRHCRYISVHCL